MSSATNSLWPCVTAAAYVCESALVSSWRFLDGSAAALLVDLLFLVFAFILACAEGIMKPVSRPWYALSCLRPGAIGEAWGFVGCQEELDLLPRRSLTRPRSSAVVDRELWRLVLVDRLVDR